MELVFDIEANGLLDVVSDIWCIVTFDTETREISRFRPNEIQQGLDRLQSATTLIGHNIIGYDLPALEKVWGFSFSGRVLDTDPWCRLANSDQKNTDFSSRFAHLAGSHSLKAWGERLGFSKGSYGETDNAWDNFSEEMLEYCQNDVELNVILYEYLLRQNVPPHVLELEMEYVALAKDMTHQGVKLDLPKTLLLEDRLKRERDELQQRAELIVPPTTIVMKKPQYWDLTYEGSTVQFPNKYQAEQWRKQNKIRPKEVELVAGPPRTRTESFNLGSRKQVREFLFSQHEWLSPSLTDKGQELEKEGASPETLAKQYGKVSEDILQTLEFPLAKLANDYLIIDKKLSMVRSWLELQKEGRIHHRYITCGTATHRATHSTPNLGQVPSTPVDNDGNPIFGLPGRYGSECRELFCPDWGEVLVGCDLAGIESRLLGHFLYPYDQGQYIDIVLDGDIHRTNMDSINRELKGHASVSRYTAKVLGYAWMYGCSAYKSGLIAATEDSVQELHKALCEVLRKERIDSATRNRKAYKIIGTWCQKGLSTAVEGLDRFIEDVQQAAERGFLTPLDGRRLPVRSSHSALNTLLQGSAAIVFRKWATELARQVKGLKVSYRLMVHDEIQASVAPEDVEEYSQKALETIKTTGEFYRLNVALDGETKVGSNWMETH